MNTLIARTIIAPVAGAIVCLLAGPSPSGIAGTPLVGQFEARAVATSGTEDAGRVGIYIERWSTDEDLARLTSALEEGDAVKIRAAVRRPSGRVGVVLMPGVLGHGARTRMRTPKNLSFAWAMDTPAGRRVIVASDERLGLGEPRIEARKEVHEFTLVDIRFGPDGTGVGKVATAADVVYDAATGSLGIRDYETRPARLVGVKPGF